MVRRQTLFALVAVWLFPFALIAARAPLSLGGRLPGNDDRMRLVQVRDLLAGRSWFDVDQARFLTPEGGDMHWSRLPDVFIGGATWLLTPVFGAEDAGFVVATAWPLVLFAAACALAGLIAHRLGGGATVVGATIFCFGVSAVDVQFLPGRIDHHGLQIVILLAGLAALLSPARSARSAAGAGLAVAAMLAIGPESLPHAGALILAMGLLWIVRGEREARRLVVFGATAAAAGCAVLLFDAPGPFGDRAVCDAFGWAHFTGLVAGGALLSGLGILSGRLPSYGARFGAGVAAGGAALLCVGLVAPGCFEAPYGDLGPDVQTYWLQRVGEARGPLQFLRDEPAGAVWRYGYLLAAFSALAWLVWRGPMEGRERWLPIAAAFCAAAAVSFWQLRGVMFAHAIAAAPAGWVLGGQLQRWWAVRGPRLMLGVAAAGLALTPIGWRTSAQVLAAPAANAGGVPAAANDASDCQSPLEAPALAALQAQPPGPVFASLDLGSWILMATDHQIFAAPYHRNPGGIGFSLDVFGAAPDDAREKLSAAGAAYVAYCPHTPVVRGYAQDWPEGFAAAMERGETPDWLVPLHSAPEDGDNPLSVYAIAPWSLAVTAVQLGERDLHGPDLPDRPRGEAGRLAD